MHNRGQRSLITPVADALWQQFGNGEEAIPGDGGGGGVPDGRNPVADAVVGSVQRSGGGQTEPVHIMLKVEVY